MSDGHWVQWPPVVGAYDRSRHAVIEASAGTGKTFTLEHLILRELIEGTPLDRILVVTFTEKATDELRRRVRDQIDAVLRDRGPRPTSATALDASQLAPLVRARDAFERAAISTIHGFCQRVLDEHAFGGGRYLREEVADGGTIHDAAFQALLTGDAVHDPAVRRWLDPFLERHEDLDLVRGLLGKVAGMPAARVTPAFDLDAIRAGMEALSLDGAKSEIEPGATTLVNAKIRAAIEILDSRDPVRAVVDRDTLAALVASGRPKKRPHTNALADALPAFLDGVPSLVSATALALLPGFRRAVAAHKAREGLRDYDDMLTSLQAAVTHPDRGPQLVASLRAQYEVALIDEFQDTDEVQWSIFRDVFTLGSEQRLIVIGDPKQAIYGFRGADVETYARATTELVDRGAQRIDLDVCYRSTQAMVEAYRSFLADDVLTDASPGPITAAAGAPVFEDPLFSAPIVRLDLPPGGVGAAREAHGVWIAQEILRLVREATLDGRGLRPADILLLTYSRVEGILVGRILRERGVRVAFYKQDGLFQSPEARAIRDVLAAVASPNDLEATLRALLTPFFELPLGVLRYIEPGRAHPAVDRIGAWATLGEHRQYASLFAAIFDDSGLLRRAAFRGGEERAVTNYLHLAELVIERIALDPPVLSDVVTWLDRCIAGRASPPGRDSNVQRLESDAGAVQIMTVHKAKGLEAAVVFLFGGLRKGPARYGPWAYRHDGARHYDLRSLSELNGGRIRALIEEEERREEGRLAYVAMTRAKARSYVHTMPKSTGRHAALAQRVAAWMYAPFQAVEVSNDRDRPLSLLRPAGSISWTPPARLIDKPEADPFAPLRAAHAAIEVTSYSRIKSETTSHLDPELELRLGEDPEPAPLELVPGELPPGPDSGVFLHQILEHAPLASVRDLPGLDPWRARDEVRALIDAALLEHRVSRDHRADAERLVHAALTATLPLDPPLLGLAAAEQVVREMDFLFPWPHAFVKGYLDVVVQHAERTWVIDWKSDRLPAYDESSLSRHVEARYRLQVQLYALALAKIVNVDDAESHALRFGGVVYVFMRGLGGKHPATWVERPSWTQLTDWAARLPLETRGKLEATGQTTLFGPAPSTPAPQRGRKRRR